MGEFKKYIARSFFFWMVRFLRTKYDNVEIVFISHHTEAREVTEEQFFTQGESGGTVVSSAYQLALDIIGARYRPTDWNIYPFHFSDGDNYYSDNEEAVRLADELIQTCNLFGYGEIGEEGGGGYRRSSGALLSIFNDRLQEQGALRRRPHRRQGGRLPRAQAVLRPPRRRGLEERRRSLEERGLTLASPRPSPRFCQVRSKKWMRILIIHA